MYETRQAENRGRRAYHKRYLPRKVWTSVSVTMDPYKIHTVTIPAFS